MALQTAAGERGYRSVHRTITQGDPGNSNQDEKELQRKQMEYKQVERDNRNFHHTVDATTDTYMKNALSHVRQS